MPETTEPLDPFAVLEPGNPPQLKRIEYGSPAWERSMAVLADQFLRVAQCLHCGAACNYGYICMRCYMDDSGIRT